MRRCRGGFTLAEVLVGGFVMLLVMTIAYMLTVLTMRYTVAGQDRVSVHVNDAYSVQRLWLRMHEAPIGSLTDNTALATPALSFLTCRDGYGAPTVDALGNPTWQAYCVFYVTSDGSLRYRRVKPAGLPSTLVTALSSGSLSAYCDGSGDVVASAISGLSLSGLNLAERTLTVTVTASVGTPVDNGTTYSAEVTFQP